MKRYEHLKLKLSDIPSEIIKIYNIKDKATADGSIYVDIRKGMYGLPQARLTVKELLKKRLAKHEYSQSKLVPGLWSHEWRTIQFTMVVDDFGVKYVGKENSEHLIYVLQKNHL